MSARSLVLFSLWEGREKREPGIHCLRMLENYPDLGNHIPLYITVKLYSNLIRILATVFVLRTETASAVSSLLLSSTPSPVLVC